MISQYQNDLPTRREEDYDEVDATIAVPQQLQVQPQLDVDEIQTAAAAPIAAASRATPRTLNPSEPDEFRPVQSYYRILIQQDNQQKVDQFHTILGRRVVASWGASKVGSKKIDVEMDAHFKVHNLQVEIFDDLSRNCEPRKISIAPSGKITFSFEERNHNWVPYTEGGRMPFVFDPNQSKIVPSS